MTHDIAVGANAILPTGASQLKKPPYLIILQYPAPKNQNTIRNFISLDKPEIVPGYLQAKGVFTDSTEEEIVKNYNEILASTSQELILEMMFPNQRVVDVRSLRFSANKNFNPNR